MGTHAEAAYADHHYLNYKRDMEGTQTGQLTAESHPVLRVAVFGLGRIGTIHLENLSRRPSAVSIRYCVDESDERINFVRNKWRLLQTAFIKPQDQDVVYKDNDVDAVLVCTPTFTHEEIILKSLASGKAVFCEKPLALTDEGIERCLQASKDFNKPLLCAFNRRFDPGLRSLRERTLSGEIGRVQIIKTCSRDSPRPSVEYLKISGGIFHDCAVHDIDFICWVLGEYPESVSSYAHVYFPDIADIDDFDTVAITMKFPSGALAIVDLSRSAIYGYDQRAEIFGSKGMLTNGDQRPTGVELHSTRGSTAVPIFYSFASRYQEAYAFEIDHFVRVAQGKEECEVNGESILAVSKIASACEVSARTKKTVTLDWGT